MCNKCNVYQTNVDTHFEKTYSSEYSTISEGPNLAANKPAWQSSITQQGFATNPITEHESGDVNFARTLNSDSPWWIVDLEAEFEIGGLVIQTGKIKSQTGWLNPFLHYVEKDVQCTSGPQKRFSEARKMNCYTLTNSQISNQVELIFFSHLETST